MGRTLLLLVSLGVATAASAEVYRWTDANGRVHYGERPPVGAERIELPRQSPPPAMPTPSDSERRERQRRMLDAFAHKREQKRQRAERDAKARRERARECERIKRHWRQWTHPGPIYTEQPDGGRSYIDEAGRQAELERLRPAYRDACGEEPG